MNPLLFGAMGAAEEGSVGFNAVPDHFAPAMSARWSQRMNRTLEAIEGMRTTLHGYLECFIVLVTTGFTLCHGMALLTEHCTSSEDWSNAHAKGAADRVSLVLGWLLHGIMRATKR
jgi:hypothetical protein